MKTLLLALALIFSTPSDAMRCTGGLVLEGDDMFTVIDKCGLNHGEITSGGNYGPKKTMWRYKFTASGAVYMLTFRDDILVNIKMSR